MHSKITSVLVKIVRSTGPKMPKEDEPTGIIAPLKDKLRQVMTALSPGNIAKQVCLVILVLISCI